MGRKKILIAAALFIGAAVVFQNCGQNFEALDGERSGSFRLAAQGSDFQISAFPSGRELFEGGGSVNFDIQIQRGPQSNGTINLTVRPAQPQDMAFMDTTISSPSLAAGQTQSELRLQLAIGNRPLRGHQRRFIVRGESGNITREKIVTLNIKPTDAPDIYLLVGQSNMVGSTLKANQVSNPEDAKYLPLDQPIPRIQQLNVKSNLGSEFVSLGDFRNLSKSLATPTFTMAEDPLHNPLRPGQASKSDTSIGPGLSFARYASQLTDQEVILIPAAWGGTGFCKLNENLNRSWNPDLRPEPEFGGTGLFDRAVLRTNYVIEQTGGILRGILWNQGRHDSYSGTCTPLYQENVIKLIAAFRNRIRQDGRGAIARGLSSDVPFIGATMSQGKDSRQDYSQPNAREIIVDGVYRSLSNTVPYTDYVNMDDIKPPQYPCGAGSCAHFGGRGYRIMGRRYFEAFQRILDRTSFPTGYQPNSPNSGNASGLVAGTLYRWDGRNFIYTSGNTCFRPGPISDIAAGNNLDSEKNSARYSALGAEVKNSNSRICSAGDTVNPAPSPGGSSPAPADSGLVSGTLYRWDGRNFIYTSGNTCFRPGPISDIASGNNLDSEKNSARYLALGAEVKNSNSRICSAGDTVSPAPSPGGSSPAPADSGLISGTLYRWDGRNFIYTSGNTCFRGGPISDIGSGNNLDSDKNSSRYSALRIEIQNSKGRICP